MPQDEMNSSVDDDDCPLVAAVVAINADGAKALQDVLIAASEATLAAMPT